MPDLEFQAALRRYAQLREAAFNAAEDEARQFIALCNPFRFKRIDRRAIDAWRSTWRGSHPLGYGGWSWDDLVRPIWRRPSAFHLAIWSDDQLCGLAIGRASKRRSDGRCHTLSLNFLEANPHPGHPLKGHVADLVIECADSYAAALGAEKLRLVNPLSGLLRFYMRLGFSVAGSGFPPVHLERRVQRRWR